MSKNRQRASVIVSVYKNADALRVVLDSLSHQTENSFEIIISQDGDDKVIEEVCASYPFKNRWTLITQQDLGWRKNRALNNAIKAAKNDWLIFIDGDSFLHPRFVEYHLRLSGQKNIVAGKRVKLNKQLSQLLLEEYRNIKIVKKKLLKSLFSKHKDIEFIEEGFFINPNGVLGFIPRIRRVTNLKGCNMSFSKDAIYAINGFDQDYTLPAIGEDIDLTWRFLKAGYRIVSARNTAVQYHLYHVENWVSQEENIRQMKEKRDANLYICKNGLKK